MDSKVEKLEVALSQNVPFEDEVVELAPKFIRRCVATLPQQMSVRR